LHGVSPIELRFAGLDGVSDSASNENFVALVLFHCTNHKIVSSNVTPMSQMRYSSDCNSNTIVVGKVPGFC
jgi:hypothetical protein